MEVQTMGIIKLGANRSFVSLLNSESREQQRNHLRDPSPDAYHTIALITNVPGTAARPLTQIVTCLNVLCSVHLGRMRRMSRPQNFFNMYRDSRIRD